MLSQMCAHYFTNEKLGARNVVRSNWPPLGDAVAEHADTRYRDGLSGDVFARGDKHLRRSRHHPAIRNFRLALDRSRKILSLIKRVETSGDIFPRDVLPTDVSEIC